MRTSGFKINPAGPFAEDSTAGHSSRTMVSGHPDSIALVSYGPASKGQWKLEPVVPRPLNDDEVLVRIVASGVCLADLHMGDTDADSPEAQALPAVWYPRVLGHEGSGYVEQVGRAVKNVKLSDPVVLSFNYCDECYTCSANHPAYCTQSFRVNFCGEKAVYAREGADDYSIGGSFFGQSSFSSRAVVKARCVVNLAGQRVTEDELRTFAPFGCAVQTGAGAFTNIADVQAGQDVAVLGVGGVGQSAVIAAAMRKCKTIIAIDRSSSRLELAQSLGATHTINTSDPGLDLVAQVRDITAGQGVHVSLDTTGVASLARQSWEFVRFMGKVLQVGLAKPSDRWEVPMANHMNTGKQIIGCLEGDAVPVDYIPKMIDWYKQGVFPIDRIVKFYPARDFEQALADMRTGVAIKPVLLWG